MLPCLTLGVEPGWTTALEVIGNWARGIGGLCWCNPVGLDGEPSVATVAVGRGSHTTSRLRWWSLLTMHEFMDASRHQKKYKHRLPHRVVEQEDVDACSRPCIQHRQ